MIRTREYVDKNESVFKIGKTENELGLRLGQYGKGGEVIFSIAGDAKKILGYEQQLINIFKSKFIQKLEIGTEYFEGDMKKMVKCIYECMFNQL